MPEANTTIKYRCIVCETLTPYEQRKYAYGEIQNELVFDIERDRYLVVSVGRDYRGLRVNHILIHLDIVNGKIWLQRDNTSDDIAEVLIAASIPKSDIVLGFHPPELRTIHGFAAT